MRVALIEKLYKIGLLQCLPSGSAFNLQKLIALSILGVPEQISGKWERDLKAKKRKYDDPVKKRQAVRKRYEDKK